MPKRNALTLIEVMLVMGIVVIMATMAMVVSRGPLMDIRLRKSADLMQTEWTRLRIKAMDDGHIYCFRSTLGGDRFRVDRILDVHFSSGIPDKNNAIRSERQKQIEDETMDYDLVSDEDFQLQDPDSGIGNVVTRSNLPETCFFADGYVVPDERADYYTKTVTQGQGQIGYDGVYWSAPIFFFPDGTTSTATFLLKNDFGKCIEVHLRGLTGITTRSDLSLSENYRGSLKAQNNRSTASGANTR